MTKMLKITLNGETFLADILWDKAPEACKLFESSCPVESRIFSAKICDAEVTYPVFGPHRQLRAHREPRLSRASGRRELVWRMVINLHLL